MKINGKYSITIKRDNKGIITNLLTGENTEYPNTSGEFMYLRAIANICLDKKSSAAAKNNQLLSLYTNVFNFSGDEIKERLFEDVSENPANADGTPKKLTKSQLRSICNKIINFFSLFNKKPVKLA